MGAAKERDGEVRMRCRWAFLRIGRARLACLFAGCLVVGVLADLRAAEQGRAAVAEAKEQKTHAAKPAHTRFFHKINHLVENLEFTEYQHRTRIDEENKSFRCDCSGFLGYFLKQDFRVAYQSLLDHKIATWAKRPLAGDFYQAFIAAEGESVPGWQAVTRVADAEPGDLLAWQREKIGKGSITGHVLMIASKPQRDPDGRFRVRVIDSTRSLHFEDTRGKDGTGVGAGIMWFAVDDKGRPVRYYRDDSPKPGKTPLIAIGRPMADPNP